jgi:hypothetical protein
MKSRFPPPWSVEDIGAAFVVKDNDGQQLAYIYFEDEPGQLTHVVEIAIPSLGLEPQTSRDVTDFHRSRNIDVQFGHAIKNVCRWCFSDATTAEAFKEQFGGNYVEKRPAELIEAHERRLSDVTVEEIEEGPEGETSLQLLQTVYRDRRRSISTGPFSNGGDCDLAIALSNASAKLCPDIFVTAIAETLGYSCASASTAQRTRTGIACIRTQTANAEVEEVLNAEKPPPLLRAAKLRTYVYALEPITAACA